MSKKFIPDSFVVSEFRSRLDLEDYLNDLPRDSHVVDVTTKTAISYIVIVRRPGEAKEEEPVDLTPKVADYKELTLRHLRGFGWENNIYADAEDVKQAIIAEVQGAGLEFNLADLRKAQAELDHEGVTKGVCKVAGKYYWIPKGQ